MAEFLQGKSNIQKLNKKYLLKSVNIVLVIFFTFVPRILILSKFYLFANWCTSELF